MFPTWEALAIPARSAASKEPSYEFGESSVPDVIAESSDPTPESCSDVVLCAARESAVVGLDAKSSAVVRKFSLFGCVELPGGVVTLAESLDFEVSCRLSESLDPKVRDPIPTLVVELLSTELSAPPSEPLGLESELTGLESGFELALLLLLLLLVLLLFELGPDSRAAEGLLLEAAAPAELFEEVLELLEEVLGLLEEELFDEPVVPADAPTSVITAYFPE